MKLEIAKGITGLIRTKKTNDPSFPFRESSSDFSFGFLVKRISSRPELLCRPKKYPITDAIEYAKIKNGKPIQPIKKPEANAVNVVGSKANPISKAVNKV